MTRPSFNRIWTAYAVLLCIGLCAPAFGSSHREAPEPAGNNPTVDLTDLFAWTRSNKIYFVVCSNPDVSATDPAPFKPGTSYEIKIDQNQDTRADTTMSVDISRSTDGGSQFINVFSNEAGEKKELIGSGQTGQTILLQNGGRIIANIFDDPFFFNQEAYEQFQQTGDANSFNPSTAQNSFARENVAAIVIELPLDAIRPSTSGAALNVWARTVKRGHQYDRTGMPGLSMLLIPERKESAFARGKPKNDQRFLKDITSSLVSLGNSRADSRALARTLVPNVLLFNPSDTSTYPNGRFLDDDVMDYLLRTITLGRVTSDYVNNDSNFSDTFPFLAPPNTSSGGGAPTATHVAAGSGNSQDVINISNKNAFAVDVTFGADSVSTTTINVSLSDGIRSVQGTSTNAPSGAGIVNFSGINGGGLIDGSVTVRITGSTIAGNSINVSGTPATKDTAAPTAPTSGGVVAGTGNSANEINSTNASAVNVAADFPMGSCCPNDTVAVTLSDGTNNVTSSTMPVPNGAGSVSFAGLNTTSLGNGLIIIRFNLTDVFSNSTTIAGNSASKH